MAFFTNALRVEQPLGKLQQGFPAVGGLCYWYTVCWQGSDCMCDSKKGRGRAWNICLQTGTGELVPRGACDIATNPSVSPGKRNVLGIFAWKRGRGSWCHGVPAILLPTSRGALGRGACLEYFLGKRHGGVGATGCLRYCYQLFGEPWEGEHAWNICLEKGTGELVPRGAWDIATNISRSFGKGRILGTLSRRSPLLHMLCEQWQKAKNAVENHLQHTTSEMEHFG